jgi:tRNA(fMet)-specific endonuclease VapC
MSFLLDTDHIGILQRESGAEFIALSERIARSSLADLAFLVISFDEQVLGCLTYLNRARNSAEVVRGYGMLARVIRDFGVAPVLPYDIAAAGIFDGLVAQRLRVGTMDLRIAAIALSNGLVLLTRNIGDFDQVNGLRIENWTA